MSKIILILYSKEQYDGVAEALDEYVSKHCRDTRVVLADENRYCNFYSNKIATFFYKFSIRNCAWMNRLITTIREKIIFRLKNNKKDNNGQELNDSQAEKKQSSSFMLKFRKVDNIFKRFNPNVVLCLTPKAHEKALRARNRLEMKMPIYAVMTDYCLNKAFIANDTDGYLVQNHSIAQTMLTMGIDENKIFEFNTPILSSRMKNIDGLEVLKKFGIEKDLPNVVIIGGRYGSAKIKNAFTVLSSYTSNINLIVLSNGSDSIFKYIKTLCKATENVNNIYCIDKLEKIEELYSICDVLVCTPTAAITYEACARQIPCVLLKDNNNMEKGNASYLLSRGFAFRGETKEQVVSSVLNLLNDSELYQEHIAKLPKEFPVDSAKEIVEFLKRNMYIPQEMLPEPEQQTMLLDATEEQKELLKEGVKRKK